MNIVDLYWLDKVCLIAMSIIAVLIFTRIIKIVSSKQGAFRAKHGCFKKIKKK